MPSFSKVDNNWHLFYVQYASAASNSSGWYSNFHGQIMHSVSTTQSVGGPYRDVGVVLSPGKDSQSWEGLQGTDSISPPFKLKNSTFAAFYGSAHTRNPRPPDAWKNGIVLAEEIGGNFTRLLPSSLVNFNNGGSENPIVTYLSSYSLYLAVFDDLHAQSQGFGYSTSIDGLNWKTPASIAVVPGGTRTPQGSFLEDDGTLTVFYSAGNPELPHVATMDITN
eukprot:m.40503 g.40503  ORF g.40503 m.40503 type:complete len:222 (+) comp9668_c0_seq1:578-1243(+)